MQLCISLLKLYPTTNFYTPDCHVTTTEKYDWLVDLPIDSKVTELTNIKESIKEYPHFLLQLFDQIAREEPEVSGVVQE